MKMESSFFDLPWQIDASSNPCFSSLRSRASTAITMGEHNPHELNFCNPCISI